MDYKEKARELRKITRELRELNPNPFEQLLLKTEDDISRMIWAGQYIKVDTSVSFNMTESYK